jgi:flagellar FliJ protein
MKGFRFRLERVLELRHRLEKEHAQAVGRALREEEARRQALDAAAERLGRCGEQIAGAAGDLPTAGTLHNLGLALRAAADALANAEVRHRDAVASVEQEQERFGEARRERRVVERLREHEHERWAQESTRHEQSEADEVARQRHGREETSW